MQAFHWTERGCVFQDQPQQGRFGTTVIEEPQRAWITSMAAGGVAYTRAPPQDAPADGMFCERRLVPQQ